MSFENTSGSPLTLDNDVRNGITGGTQINFVGANDLTFTGGLTIVGDNRKVSIAAGRRLSFGSLATTQPTLTMEVITGGFLELTGPADASLNGGGSLDVEGGSLALGHKDALGAVRLRIGISAPGTVQATADLSGDNAVPNHLLVHRTMTVTGSHNLTISGSVALAPDTNGRTITNNVAAGSKLVFSGPFRLSNAGTTNVPVHLQGTGFAEISGPIEDGVNSNRLVKLQSGTLRNELLHRLDGYQSQRRHAAAGQDGLAL